MENQKLNAPYAVGSLVLGICSILTGCLFVGLICGIIGLVLANKGLAEYHSCPNAYDGCGLLKAGKVTSIIGVIFGALSTVYCIICALFWGSIAVAWLTLLGGLL